MMLPPRQDFSSLNANMPSDFFLQYFYLHAGGPHKMSNGMYKASCPICREGKSWLKKKRCYYNSKENLVFCHNCGWAGTGLKWLMVVTGKSLSELQQEMKENIYDASILLGKKETSLDYTVPVLPRDCINIYDSIQMNFYKDNLIVAAALKYLKDRRLLSAHYKPTTLYLNLTDPVHKNRIVIPFWDNKKILYYQSRSFLPDHEGPKYLSKKGGTRSIFNYDKVDPDYPYVFIFEGPFNSCFVKNGLAIAGIQEHSDFLLTDVQQAQLNILPHKIIWVLDSQWIDEAAFHKTSQLIEQGKTVFIWPKNIGQKFKDINDLAISAKTDSINPDFFIENSYHGDQARLKYSILKSMNYH